MEIYMFHVNANYRASLWWRLLLISEKGQPTTQPLALSLPHVQEALLLEMRAFSVSPSCCHMIP